MTKQPKTQAVEFKDIPASSFIVKDETTIKREVVAIFRESGFFAFNADALKHFVQAAYMGCEADGMLYKDAYKFIAKLAVCLTEVSEAKDKPNMGLDFTREEIKQLLVYVKYKMAHCEKEKAEQSVNFNADTYISMKLLMCELMMWLSVEEVTGIIV